MPKCFVCVFMAFKTWSTFWISSWSLQWFFSRNACRMCQQLFQIDHPDPVTKMPSGRSLVSILPRVIRLTLLTSLPGPGRCSARQHDHRRTLPPGKRNNWCCGSQGLAAAAGGVWRTIGIIEIQLIYEAVPQFVAVMGSEF